MIQNLVLNNSDFNLSAVSDQLRANFDQPKVVATPGTDAAQVSHLRAQLESGALTSAGSGINAEYSA
ncbi:MAG TPA: hypothetical protein VGP41_12325 [Candidatus Lustribacter sp.]|jgi:hypothetical protein|nr:hypothetical protein [Candidatus Lustribacter sp.]